MTEQPIDERADNLVALGLVVVVQVHAEGEFLVDVHDVVVTCRGERLVSGGCECAHN